jgi:hypothetical protein
MVRAHREPDLTQQAFGPFSEPTSSQGAASTALRSSIAVISTDNFAMVFITM